MLVSYWQNLVRTTPLSGRPRPMFAEWRGSDWGPGWSIIGYYGDDTGTMLTADPMLNIVVVFAVTKEHAVPGWMSVGADHALLQEGTPYEVTVQRTADVLVWVDLNGRRDLRMLAGVARETLDEVRRERHEAGGNHDVLDVVLRTYCGPDGATLEELIENFKVSRGDG